jgi:DNA-directed RNA polymerase subunit E'/Rpb7
MHKSEHYGKILLKQKFKQTLEQNIKQTLEQKLKQSLNFACQLACHLPYKPEIIEASIIELIEEGVMVFEGDFLVQKRMVRDNELSVSRSKSGRKGGKTTQNFAKAKVQANAKAKVQANAKAEAKAKVEANTEIEYIYKEDSSNKQVKINKPKDLEVTLGSGDEKKTSWNTMPGNDLLGLALPGINAGKVKELWQITKRQKLSDEDCAGLWEVFKVQNLTGKKFYADVGDVYSHFLNWTKNQKISHGNTEKSKPGTSQARIDRARTWGRTVVSGGEDDAAA